MFAPRTARANPLLESDSPFQRLKPVCVQILGLASSPDLAADQAQNLAFSLRRLNSLLDTVSAQRLSPALISYVFFPIAQLLRARPRGAADLPDQIRQLVFETLAILASHWWHAWSSERTVTAGTSATPKPDDWSIWQQLLILGTVAAGGPPSNPTGSPPSPSSSQSSFSEETKLAAATFLHELLRPRFAQAKQPTPTPDKKSQQESWEWDGQSDLPSLDELEREQQDNAEAQAAIPPVHSQIYPTPEHISFAQADVTARGAVGHALTSCLDIACHPDSMIELRITALKISHDLLRTWIAGAVQTAVLDKQMKGSRSAFYEYVNTVGTPVRDDDKASAKNAAQKIRPLLPGITSSLSRLISSRPKGDFKLKNPRKQTPGELCHLGLIMLRDLILLSLGDATTTQIRQTSKGKDSGLQPAEDQAQPKAIRQLRDFAHVDLNRAYEDDSKPPLGPSSTTDEAAQEAPADDEPEPSEAQGTTAKWLLSTLARVQIAMSSFSPLAAPFSMSSNSSSTARRGLTNLALLTIQEMHQGWSLLQEVADDPGESALEMLISWIIDLASDGEIDSVQQDARLALETLVATEDAALRNQVLVAIKHSTAKALTELPKAIRAEEGEKVERLAIRLNTAASFAAGSLQVQQDEDYRFLQSQEAFLMLSELFGPTGRVEQWGTGLLNALEIRPRGSAGSNTSYVINDQDWPPRPHLSSLEPSSRKVVFDMFRSLGRAAAAISSASTGSKSSLDTFHFAFFFIQQGDLFRSNRTDSPEAARSATAILIASELFRGITEGLDDKHLAKMPGEKGKRLRKIAHRLGKQIFRQVMDIWESDWEEVVERTVATSVSKQNGSQRQTSGDGSSLLTADQVGEETLVEYVKGLSLEPQSSSVPEMPPKVGPALQLDFIQAAKLSGPKSNAESSAVSRAAVVEASINTSNALLFSLLSSSALLLGQYFRPLMLRGIYPLVSGLASSDSDLRTSAEAAFHEIAHASAYASIQSCVLDHADYLLGAACQRLISGLDEELRAHVAEQAMLQNAAANDSNLGGKMVSAVLPQRRKVGAVTLTPLISAQKAPFVLVEMIRMLGSEVVPLVEDALDEIMEALDRFHGHESVCAGLLSVLDGILNVMADEQKRTGARTHIEQKPASDPIDKFISWYKSHVQGDNEIEPAHDGIVPDQKADLKSSSTEEPEATRSQKVAAQILEKAVPFLSHPSPQLRARVLSLLRHGVEVLGPQKREAELLPVVNRAWPFVMARLGRSMTSGQQHKSYNYTRTMDPEDKIRRADPPLSETEPFVWIEAARFVESTAVHVPQFVGKRIVQDAWPRFEALLRMLKVKFGPQARVRPGPKTLRFDMAKDESNVYGEVPLILSSGSALPAELTISILNSLTYSVNLTLSNETGWELSINPYLLATLDGRQPETVRRAGKRLFIALARYDWDCTWFAFQVCLPSAARASMTDTTAKGMPDPRLHRQDHLMVPQETIEEILDASK